MWVRNSLRKYGDRSCDGSGRLLAAPRRAILGRSTTTHPRGATRLQSARAACECESGFCGMSLKVQLHQGSERERRHHPGGGRRFHRCGVGHRAPALLPKAEADHHRLPAAAPRPTAGNSGQVLRAPAAASVSLASCILQTTLVPISAFSCETAAKHTSALACLLLPPTSLPAL